MNVLTTNKEHIWYRYWTSFGKGETLRKDVYLWVALGLNLITFPLWISPGWWDSTINVIAILIGFSVSTFSVVLTLADKLINRLTVRDSYDGASPLLELIAGYVHYLLIGFVTLGTSIFAKAWHVPQWFDKSASNYDFLMLLISSFARCYWCVCMFFFWYSITSGVRCLMSVFRLCIMIQSIEDWEGEIKASIRERNLTGGK